MKLRLFSNHGREQMLVANSEDVHVTAEPSNGPIGLLCRELTGAVTGRALSGILATT